jgi:hypothetical protein
VKSSIDGEDSSAFDEEEKRWICLCEIFRTLFNVTALTPMSSSKVLFNPSFVIDQFHLDDKLIVEAEPEERTWCE